jgi:hypothetical protein
MSPQQNAALTKQVSVSVMAAVLAYDNAKPRSTQLHIGPSEVGHCREYLRAKIAGDAEVDVPVVKWAAAIGTAVGEYLEGVMKGQGAMTQVPITYTLPSLGFQVSGSLDVLWPKAALEVEALPYEVPGALMHDAVWDWKSKDGLDGILREGPERKEWVQISIYLLAALDAGFVTEDALGSLVYYDRSGKSKDMLTYSVTVEEARGWITAAEERLNDVVEALADPAYGDAERHLRDVAESKCWYFACPFYWQCWPAEEYAPQQEITDESLIAAMRKYDEARELAKTAKKLQDEAKAVLGVGEETPVEGVGGGYSLAWKLSDRQGVVIRTIDLRVLR